MDLDGLISGDSMGKGQKKAACQKADRSDVLLTLHDNDLVPFRSDRYILDWSTCQFG